MKCRYNYIYKTILGVVRVGIAKKIIKPYIYNRLYFNKFYTARYEFQKNGSNVQMFKEFESLLKKQTCICSVNVIVSKMAS